MFKKIMMIAGFAILSLSSFAQETSFGVTAGYLNSIYSVKDEVYNYNLSESGYYVGAFLDISLNESLSLVPGVNYSNSHDSNMLYVPLMLKYSIADSGFYLQGGPQASIIFDEERVRHNQDFGIDLGFGLGYDINEHFFVEAKYYHEVTNRFKDHEFHMSNDLKEGLNSLMIGVGYKF